MTYWEAFSHLWKLDKKSGKLRLNLKLFSRKIKFRIIASSCLRFGHNVKERKEEEEVVWLIKKSIPRGIRTENWILWTKINIQQVGWLEDFCNHGKTKFEYFGEIIAARRGASSRDRIFSARDSRWKEIWTNLQFISFLWFTASLGLVQEMMWEFMIYLWKLLTFRWLPAGVDGRLLKASVNSTYKSTNSPRS